VALDFLYLIRNLQREEEISSRTKHSKKNLDLSFPKGEVVRGGGVESFKYLD